MRRVQYAGGEFLTSDAVADELVDYAAELARRGDATRLEVPIVAADGTVAGATVVLGPASQLVVMPAPDEPDVRFDDDAGRIRRERTDRVPPAVDAPAFDPLDLP